MMWNAASVKTLHRVLTIFDALGRHGPTVTHCLQPVVQESLPWYPVYSSVLMQAETFEAGHHISYS